MKKSSKKSVTYNNLSTNFFAQFQGHIITADQLSQIKGGADIIIVEDVVEG